MPGGSSSSPVTTRPTRGRRRTASTAQPTEAARPTSWGRRRRPLARIRVPTATSSPTAPTWRPGGTGARTASRPSTSSPVLRAKHGVRTVGHRRAGHDADRLPRREGRRPRPAGQRQPDDGQVPRVVLLRAEGLLAAHGPAVHGGARERGHGVRADHVLGEDPAGAAGEPDALGVEGDGLLVDPGLDPLDVGAPAEAAHADVVGSRRGVRHGCGGPARSPTRRLRAPRRPPGSARGR